MAKLFFPCAAYIVGGFLTFGIAYNSYDCSYTQQKHACAFQQENSSVLKGLVWPVYWAGRAALEVTK